MYTYVHIWDLVTVQPYHVKLIMPKGCLEAGRKHEWDQIGRSYISPASMHCRMKKTGDQKPRCGVNASSKASSAGKDEDEGSQMKLPLEHSGTGMSLTATPLRICWQTPRPGLPPWVCIQMRLRLYNRKSMLKGLSQQFFFKAKIIK